MAKKKSSTQDFINLLDDQELANEKPPFKPAKAKRTQNAGKSASQARSKSSFRLTPMQKEWLRFAAGRCPEFITRAVTSDRAVNFLEKIYVSLDEALTVLHRAKAARAADAHSPAKGASSDSSTH